MNLHDVGVGSTAIVSNWTRILCNGEPSRAGEPHVLAATTSLWVSGEFEICPVCFWEDDGQDDHDADHIRGGPNGMLSLTEARRNYVAFGACDERSKEFVRAPLPEEKVSAG